jgi:hypothetical protein
METGAFPKGEVTRGSGGGPGGLRVFYTSQVVSGSVYENSERRYFGCCLRAGIDRHRRAG